MPDPVTPPPTPSPSSSAQDWVVHDDPESVRLRDDAARKANWKRWGPYLSERQWGTVREDYSPDGNCWNYLPHDHARSRAYRWGEDGLLGITDRECRVCFALALWNGKDAILKERLFGLTGPEGNHGEDCKENYYYIDSTPTHSFMRALYKYPRAAFPYGEIVDENRKRTRNDNEFELNDTGVFDPNGEGSFDVEAQYAKAGPDDVLVRVVVTNRSRAGTPPATLHVLPTLWFRNTWSWGPTMEGAGEKPSLKRAERAAAGSAADVLVEHPTLGSLVWSVEASGASAPEMLFTENDTNMQRLFGAANPSLYVKDAFHRRVVDGDVAAVNPANTGTKAAAWYRLSLEPGASVTLRLRLRSRKDGEGVPAFGPAFDEAFAARQRDADQFYANVMPKSVPAERRLVARQAYAGMLWSKQFFYYVVEEWLAGDKAHPPPPAARMNGRNKDWPHLFNRDVISMPDKWEYPWYAAWDLAFHMIAFAQIDQQFAKDQLLLFLREWYMHPNGQLPAYEFAFGDVNPPVHAWACWRVYKITAPPGKRDLDFLERAFQKLLLNFTWWVNRKDPEGKNIFAGGFLGLDNIGVFDRSAPLPTGGHLEQADGTAWIAFYCGTMLAMALELAKSRPAYEDIASKFFEHFIHIADAINTFGGTGLWDEEDGFYYDQLRVHGQSIPLRVRSLVGIMPITAVETIEEETIDALPGFRKRAAWFLKNRPELGDYTAYKEESHRGKPRRLLALTNRDRLRRVLRYVLDESEFLSTYGVRSVSRFHHDNPYVFKDAGPGGSGQEHKVAYTPGESDTWLFGGNSNWRGPIWFPINYLIIEALERYHRFYGESFTVECPVGSGRMLTLDRVADELRERLVRIFLADPVTHMRPCHGVELLYANDPAWKDLVLFHEYFHGDTGRGLGASHQTGWTGLVAPLIADPYWRVDKAEATEPRA
ncbi:MAG: MGH1-like glycoside hydrolase domain-containing protein [Phycisphaerales bacterium]